MRRRHHHHHHGLHDGPAPDPHHGMHHRHGPRCDEDRGRMWWLRARLRRRLFLWFGLTILAAAAVTVLGSRTLSTRPSFAEERQGLARVAARTFGASVDNAALGALARETAQDLGVAIAVRDARGALLASSDAACERAWLTVDTSGPDGAARTVSICAARPSRAPSHVLSFLAALAVLWGMAGVLARRLARPLEEIARVARAIADGDLDARVHVHRRVRGEERAVADTVNRMADRIRAQLDDQKELLAAVSHELRTPLGHVSLIAAMLEDLPDDAARRAQIARDLQREVEEMDALVGELLASARLDFARPSRAPVAVRALLVDAVTRRGRDDSCVDAPASLVLDGDRTLLARAVANLIDNAEKHGGGLARASAVVEGDEVRIEAWDRGRGFSDDALARAFAPPTVERPLSDGGLGLGLSLVRRIAEAHGGRAYAKNRADGGAVVGIALPRRVSSTSE